VAELSDYTAAPPAPAPRAAAVSGLESVAPSRSTPLAKLPWARIAIAVAALAAASASLLLATRLFAMQNSQLDPFLGGNTLAPLLRSALLLQVFAAACLPVFASALVVLRFKLAGARWVMRAGEICAPLSLACFVPALLNYRQWYGQPLPYLVQLLAFVLVLERLLARAFGPQANAWPSIARAADGAPTRMARIAPLTIVLAAATAYAVYMSHFTIMRHHLLGTAGFDLGIFDNLMMNAMHGRPFRSTVAVPMGSYLSNHAEYGMYLFVPLYALRPGAETLLILQSVFMGFAALPLYLFASTQVSRAAAAALACASLLFAPLHGPNFYDFHWMPMSMFFFYWLFYAIVKRNVGWIALLTVMICSMREDTAFGTIAVGLYLIATGYWPRLGTVLTLVSTLWFILVKFVIMPWAGPWWFADIYKDLMAAGERGYGSVVRTILINPNYFLKLLVNEPKSVYALHLFAPLALLPLRHPALWLLMLPGFFVTLMTTGYAPTVSIAFQYTTTWIPFLFAGTAIALRLRARERGHAAQRASVIALCAGVLCHSYVFGAILQHNTFIGGFSPVYFEMSPGERTRYEDLRALAAKIPPNVSVAATELEIPHVSTRLDAYTLKVTDGDADYLFLNKHHLDNDARQHLRKALKHFAYGLVDQRGEFVLFAKGKVSKDTDGVLRSLGLYGPYVRH
jgi:uncharacterized membrane protein